MCTVAIISEYNPFHTGHLYHINQIRKDFGEDVKIISIMSGNYTQRGEAAIMDKYLRAEIATRCGVDLVLELPFPFSCSCAEIFAKAGVRIANEIGIVDYLSFGSESGDIEKLKTVAENIEKHEFNQKLKELLNVKEYKNIGYPRLAQLAYESTFKEEVDDNIFQPNNILAIEYIKALRSINSNIKPHTISRLGSSYNEENIQKTAHQSASAIRNLMISDFDSALNFVPENAKPTLISNVSTQFPIDSEKVSSAIISQLMLTPHHANQSIYDAGGGLYNRLKNASFEATSISSLVSFADTKKYTTSRIRRVIWYSFFGVTSSDFNVPIQYTKVLGMSENGQALLKRIKKKSVFSVISKSAKNNGLPNEVLKQKALSDNADSLFQLMKPSTAPGSTYLKQSPFVLK